MALRSAAPVLTVLLLDALALVGCGSEAAQAPAVEPVEPVAPAPPEPPEPTYTIHEWGVVHFGVGEAEGMATAGPGHFASPRVGLIGIGNLGTVAYKPVLYAHLGLGVETLDFQAGVRAAGGGAILEHWPDGQPGEAGVGWQVQASAGACVGHDYPAAGSQRCATRDGFCELAELSLYETSDSACLQVGERRANNLFYRASLPTAGPIRVSIEGDVVALENVSAHAFEGEAYRVVRDASGRNTRFSIVQLPAPAQRASIAPDAPFAGTGAELLERIDGRLGSAGLTSAERAAFLRAWTVELVGGEAQAPMQQPLDGPPPLAPAPDALLYFLTDAHAAALLPLSFEPAPEAVKRALLARVHLAPGVVAAQTPPTPRLVGLRVRGGMPQVSPGLSREVVRRVVRRHLNEYRFCVESHVQAPAEGELELTLQIDPQGETRGVRVNGVDSAEARACFETAARRWTFPSPDGGGMVRVTFPMQYSNN
ncbi:MAG: AgmX/PglI C-terminal domain-containing protein [Myxococcota bacterium]